MTSTNSEQADPFEYMKRRPRPYALECDARIVLEESSNGNVPVIVLKIEHTNFDHDG